MKISIISFTEQGKKTAENIKEVLNDQEIKLYQKPKEGTSFWAERQFAEKNAMIFVGACGIAVRMIAPYIKDKLSDPPVLVIDETERYVIPILSGHVGGANELAKLIADRIGAVAVITTATDLQEKFAADVFAVKNGLQILNKDGIAAVSAKVLRGEEITISLQMPSWNTENTGKDTVGYPYEAENEYNLMPDYLSLVPYPPLKKTDIIISAEDISWKGWEQAALRLRLKEYVLGIGCKKGKTKEEISEFASNHLEDIGINFDDIAMIASIDQKKNEKGLCDFADFSGIPFVTFSEQELRQVKGEFHGSSFVELTVGVDNVCERAALAACGDGGRMILNKQAGNGITLAVAKRKWRIKWV